MFKRKFHSIHFMSGVCGLKLLNFSTYFASNIVKNAHLDFAFEKMNKNKENLTTQEEKH